MGAMGSSRLLAFGDFSNRKIMWTRPSFKLRGVPLTYVEILFSSADLGRPLGIVYSALHTMLIIEREGEKSSFLYGNGPDFSCKDILLIDKS